MIILTVSVSCCCILYLFIFWLTRQGLRSRYSIIPKPTTQPRTPEHGTRNTHPANTKPIFSFIHFFYRNAFKNTVFYVDLQT